MAGLGPELAEEFEAVAAGHVEVCDDGGYVVGMVRHEAQGGVDSSPLPVREILALVLRHDGVAFAVAHNHPGGTAEPSSQDRSATTELARAASAVGLRFLDHLIVAGDSWVSVPPSS